MIYGTYLKENLIDCINQFKECSPPQKYNILFELTSEYYTIQLNGIHIEDLILNSEDDSLTVVTQNYRKISLVLTDDFKLHCLHEDNVKIKE